MMARRSRRPRVLFRTSGRVIFEGKAYPGLTWVEVDRDVFERLRTQQRVIKACCGGKDMEFILFDDSEEE